MKSQLNLLRILIFVITIKYALTYRFRYNGCSKQLDYIDVCSEKVTCDSANHFDISDYDNNNVAYEQICSDSIHIYRSGYNRYYMPIYLKLKEIESDLISIRSNFEDSFGSALIIDLDLSNIDCSKAPSLGTMKNLRNLDLSHNAITEAKFSNQYELNSLTKIDYSHNTVNEIKIHESEFPFHKLKDINLSHNYLVTIADAVFESFSELETLDLSYNYIDSLNILTFEGTKKLVNLNLKHNRLTQLNSALLRFGKLSDLNLSENGFINITSMDLSKLRSLKTFDISSNLVANIDENAFIDTVCLKNIDLSNNHLEIIEKDLFKNLSSLVNINFSSNRLKNLPKGMFKNNYITDFSVKDNTLEVSLEKGMFEGLNLVVELDLSNQKLTIVKEFAFYELRNLKKLLLNNNHLNLLEKRAFSTLRSLEILDLSSNHISNIDFDKSDLVSLRSLLLHKNNIVQIKHECFIGLSMLNFLDLSTNNISQIGNNVFHSLQGLINFQISDNPVSGTLEENSFFGLNSLPFLDISKTELTSVKNGSFSGMIQLYNLNMSHGNISELQYNSFINTGKIDILDLSYNNLKEFIVNTTQLTNIETLLLGNNKISVISSDTFKILSRLSKLILSHNDLTRIDKESFKDQADLRNLDLSFNKNLNVNISHFQKSLNMADLLLSAVLSNITFKYTTELHLSRLEIKYVEINISKLALEKLQNVDNIVLNYNNISEIDHKGFRNVKTLRNLDLSYNKITTIQPGAFKDCILLQSLNFSHNNLAAVSYGIFRGLIYLDTIDISYNQISDLKNERFYEVHSLKVLIADHNRIKTLNLDDFSGTSLSSTGGILSIGGNPIPCHDLVKWKKTATSFAITAIKLNENSNENVEGIACNVDISYTSEHIEEKDFVKNSKILLDIKDILHNLTYTSINGKHNDDKMFNNTKYFEKLTEEFQALNKNLNGTYDNSRHLVENVSSSFVVVSRNTSLLLEKIYKALTAINIRRPSGSNSDMPIPKGDNASISMIPYINNIKRDLEDTIAFEKDNILKEVEKKIAGLTSKSNEVSMPVNGAYSSANKTESNNSIVFLEVCVSLILMILILFILYRLYNSGKFILNRYSVSTRHLAETMDNSAL